MIAPAPGVPGYRHLAVACGAVHAVVDASSVTAVLATTLGHHLPQGSAFLAIVSYNFLAFATQAAIGWAVDGRRVDRLALLAGVFLVGAATLRVDVEPVTTIVLAGLGNALFHVGAGAVTLALEEERAVLAGVFVAPGALGLGFGMWIGARCVNWLPFHAAIASSLLLLALLPAPPPVGQTRDTWIDRAPPEAQAQASRSAAGLLLLSVGIRYFLGLAVGLGCPKITLVLVGLPIAGFLGKVLGGLVADRIGWMRSSMGALLLCAPCLILGEGRPLVLLVGLVFLQMTMPVTLAALGLAFPGRPALSFGLASLAIFVGAVPAFFAEVRAIFTPAVFATLILLSAVSIAHALRLLCAMKKPRPQENLAPWLS